MRAVRVEVTAQPTAGHRWPTIGQLWSRITATPGMNTSGQMDEHLVVAQLGEDLSWGGLKIVSAFQNYRRLTCP